MRKQERELIEYVILLVGLMVFFLLLIVFQIRNERMALKIVALVGSLFYIFWGIVHHALEGRLNKKILLEYLFISSFVFLLFYLVLSA